MRHSRSILPQFYVTAPQPCPYLPGRMERKLFTALSGPTARALNDSLSQQGFRRSQTVLYRPSCPECAACMSARVRVKDFRPSKSQRRILRRNRDLVRIANAPWATEAQYALFRRYLEARHAGGGMTDMDLFEFAAMIAETPVETRVFEYHMADPAAPEGHRLVAVALTDILADGPSMVYSFFDPDLSRRSLGAYMILDHVEIARQHGQPYLYLGYWVPGSDKMGYKAAYRPLEIHTREGWQDLEDESAFDTTPHPLATEPVAEQVAAIRLPAMPSRE